MICQETLRLREIGAQMHAENFWNMENHRDLDLADE